MTPSDRDLPLVLITHPIPLEWLSTLQGKCQIKIGPAETSGFSGELLHYLPEAAGLFTLLMDRVDEKILSTGKKIKVVSNMAVGVDNVDIAACTRRGIAVGNTPGVLTNATADLTMALMLALARKLPQAAQDAKDGRWKNWAPAGWLGMDLSSAVLGIVGMGKIGSAVAHRASGFGMSILYNSRNPHHEIEETLHARRVDLDELFTQSDIISLHAPLTPETRRVVDEAAFRKMKPAAILINAARGALVDQEALYRALENNQIAAAALDVTDPEPLPSDHPLFHLSNCLILPHIGSATVGTRKNMAEISCANILAGLEGRRLPYCVNPEVYDKPT